MVTAAALRILIMLGVMAFGLAAHSENDVPSSRYMGGPAELVTAPNGAIVNKEVLEELPKTAWTEGPEIENPAEGVCVLSGYLISACIVVEADEGLIVFDTGDTEKDCEKLLKAIRSFSQKPIRSIVCGHIPYCLGAGVLFMHPSRYPMSGVTNTKENSMKVGMPAGRNYLNVRKKWVWFPKMPKWSIGRNPFPNGIPSARGEKRIWHGRWRSMQLLWNMSISMLDGLSAILRNYSR